MIIQHFPVKLYQKILLLSHQIKNIGLFHHQVTQLLYRIVPKHHPINIIIQI